MNKKIIWIITVILILTGAGIYFLNRQPPSPSHKITNFEECARAGYPVEESYPRQCWTPDGRHFVEEIGENLPPASGPITVSGEMTCLPKTGQGAQTMECAMGLKGIDGRYYGLKNLFKLDPEYKFSVGGLRVEISGTLSSEEIKGPDGNKYDVVGVIDVDSIKEIAGVSGQSSTGTGTIQPEDPEKAGLAPYPDLPLASIPQEPVDVTFAVEHRSALNGKTLSVRGFVVGTLLGEKACPPDRGMCAQPRIFLADTTKQDRNPLYDLTVLVGEEEQEKNYPIGKIINMKVIVNGSKVSIVARKIY